MRAEDKTIYLIAYVVSNIVGIAMLLAAWKKPVIARWLYLVLFGWAAYTNITVALKDPSAYLDYKNYALLNVYKNFINGLFSWHITGIIIFIACCQALIALSMLGKGIIFKIGCLGGIIFLVAIAPLGLGAAFPSTLTMATGLYLLIRLNNARYLWQAQYRPAKKIGTTL